MEDLPGVFGRDIVNELDNRLGIEAQAMGGTGEWDHAKDHAIADCVADAALQFSVVLANMTAANCNCGTDPCPTVAKAHNVLTGILIPSVALGAMEQDYNPTYLELIEKAEEMADKLHRHARASIGKPL